MSNSWNAKLPPWVQFPDMEPADLRATQGLEEAWLDHEWWPYWMSLSESDRLSYLQNWQPSDAWQSELDFLTRTREEFDLAEDVADRERYLYEQKVRPEKEKTLGLFRWFKK